MTKILAIALTLLALPSLTQAATFAFVDQGGYVRTINASTPSGAMLGASNIDEHSGVMMLTSVADYRIVDNYVGLD